MDDARHTLRDVYDTGQLAVSCPATAGLLAWLALSVAIQPTASPPRPDRRPSDHRAPDHRAPDHRPPDHRPSDHRPDQRPVRGPDDLAPAPARVRSSAPARNGVNR
ncbi:hypothetical protein [Streptomyces sp. NPDC047000]|uniref:hypothetical protein n=1 Tax=Streptomyces sp. NPDC047000 TaxID=3155474 RepID=UPI0033D33998